MRVKNLTPMLPVHDIDATCRFMSECLGFKTIVQQSGHAYCARDDGAIRIINAPPEADLDKPERQMHFYVDTDDVDAFYAEHRSALDALPEGFFRPPFDTTWGQREFHVLHGLAQFSIGQPIRKTP